MEFGIEYNYYDNEPILVFSKNNTIFRFILDLNNTYTREQWIDFYHNFESGNNAEVDRSSGPVISTIEIIDDVVLFRLASYSVNYPFDVSMEVAREDCRVAFRDAFNFITQFRG